MRVIQPNCRVQFTAEDVEFITRILNPGGRPDFLTQLLADPEARDLILDDDRLFHALLEIRGCLRVSVHFYFYVLVRQVLRRAGIDDRSVADYVAELLAQFSRAERADNVISGGERSLDYFFELLTALEGADERSRFVIRAHIGNHSLFLSGVFPARIQFRAERRGSPDLAYYEQLGRQSYRLASDHHLARKYDLAPIFTILADEFGAARRALNDLSDRLISLGDLEFPAILN